MTARAYSTCRCCGVFFDPSECLDGIVAFGVSFFTFRDYGSVGKDEPPVPLIGEFFMYREVGVSFSDDARPWGYLFEDLGFFFGG